MDPEAALQAAKSALKSARKAGRHREGAHYEEAAEYLSNYWEWRRSGGFEPKNGDRRADAMGEQLNEEWAADGESGWGEAGGVIDEGYEENPLDVPSGTRTLTRSEVLKVSKVLKSIGSKLPRVGYCIRLPDGREVCRDGRGYYIVGHKKSELNPTKNPDTSLAASRQKRNPETTAAKRRAMRG